MVRVLQKMTTFASGALILFCGCERLVELARAKLDRLEPSIADAGSPSFTMVVKGQGFLGPGKGLSTVEWNGQRLATTYRDDNTLEAEVPAALVASPTIADVTVVTNQPGGLVVSSDTLNFVVQAAAVVTDFEIASAETEFPRGASWRWMATLTYDDGTKEDVTEGADWSSSDTSVARPNADSAGTFEMLKVGKAFVIAESGAFRDSFEITVFDLVALKIVGGPFWLEVNQDTTLTTFGTKVDGSQFDVSPYAKYFVQDLKIFGLTLRELKALDEGQTWVFAELDGIRDSTPATAVELDFVDITPGPATLGLGASLRFKLRGTFSDQTTKDLSNESTFSSDNPGVVEVDSTGAAKGKAPGTANVTGTRNRFGNPKSTTTMVTVSGSPSAWKSVIAGLDYTCGLLQSGVGYCWGTNQQGELAIGTMDNNKTVPTAMATAEQLDVVSGTSFGGCALNTNGAAYCWGINSSGQLGDSTIVALQRAPTAVGRAIPYADIASGGVHNCAITSGGTTYCWGGNANGQFGNGKTDAVNPWPVLAGSGTYASVVTGPAFTCWLDNAGKAFCAGNNNRGQLGDSTMSQRALPTAVKNGLTFTQLSAGLGYTCGLAGGQAYCWGANDKGQLGNGTLIRRLAPAAVGGQLQFTSISAGGAQTCALATNGDAYCWGSNVSGALGNGTNVDSRGPVQVAGGHKFVAIEAGTSHTCGVTDQNELYCWGLNTWGALGDGQEGVESNVPVPVNDPS